MIMEVILEEKKMIGTRFLPIHLNSQRDTEFLDESSSVKVLKRLGEDSR